MQFLRIMFAAACIGVLVSNLAIYITEGLWRQRYFQVANFFLRIRYWFRGYTWDQTVFKVFAYRLQRAIDKTDWHVFRTNREL